MEKIGELMKKALEMRGRSYAPYSGFAVGAALEAADGSIYGGCNIENAAYGSTMCAERTAFFKAVSEGQRAFRRILIAGGPAGEEPRDFCPPCGSCRQVMAEFCGPEEFEIILVRNGAEYRSYKLKELLPLGFTTKNLEES